MKFKLGHYHSTNLTVILPGNGTYDVEVGLKGFPPNATPLWQAISLTCLNPNDVPLILTVTNPAGSTVSVPVIQLQGLVSKGLSNLVYDVSNANGVVTNQAGYWQPYFYDTSLLAFTTNAFQCYDIPLATGLNTITLHATDVVGNTITTNFSYTLDYSGDHTAPLLSVVWPPNGAVIAGSNITVQARIDDATATVSAVINGVTNQALVERNGTVWFNNLPLSGGTNALTITATDAAGNMSQTNFDVVQSSVNFTIDLLSSGQLNQTSITVTGTIGDPSDNVIINGVTATVSGNSWTAGNVPVSDIGTAALNAEVTDSGNNPLAIQTVYQPQPATIVVAAYEQTYRDISTFYTSWDLYTGPVLTDDEITYWTGGRGSSYGDFQEWPGEAGYPVTAGTFANDLSGYTNDLPVPWEEGNSLIASDNDLQVLHTKTTLALQPVGQDPPGAQRSYLVLVSAQEYGPFPDYNIENMVYPEALLYEVPSTPVSPERLQVNGQTVGDTGITDGNGSMWGLAAVSGPSGAALPLTLAATLTNKNDVVVPQMVLTNLQITANGVTLDVNDVVTNFVVGQAVTFALSTNMPAGVTATNFQWKFQGNYFNNQSNAVATNSYPNCSLVPFVDTNFLSLSETTNWWVSGGLNPPSNYTAFLSCTLVFSNGNSLPYQTQGQFSMLRPLPTFYGQIIGDVEVGTNYWINDTNAGGTYLHFGVNHNSDVGIALIYVNAPLMPNSTNTYGQYSMTQIINNYSVRYNRIESNVCTGYETNDAVGLDKSTPYGAGPSELESSGWPDSPGQQLSTAVWLFETNSFSSYLMFQAFPTNGSIAVPLGKVQWNWYGSATNNPWGKVSGLPSVYSATQGEDFPFWTHIIAGIDTLPEHLQKTNCFPEN